MEVYIFNILRYFLLCMLILSGGIVMRIPVSKNNMYNNVYWGVCLCPILLYSFMEGTRWGRGVDYMYNYYIANNIVKSYDIVYDTWAMILSKIGLPWVAFFVTVSFLLIFSIVLYAKLFHKAFIPMVILVYAFSMQQSENLMRQYAAISFILISLFSFIKKRFFFVTIFFLLAYFTHSSCLFIVPFFIIAYLCLNYDNDFYVVKILTFVFFFLYIISPYISYVLTNYIGDVFSMFSQTLSTKYLSGEYLEKAIDVSDDVGYLKSVTSKSFLDIFRNILRDLVIILVGGNFVYNRYLILKDSHHVYRNKKKKIIYWQQNRFLFFSWFLACCGIIFVKSLPDFNMEVMFRLSLYLCIFKCYIEGALIYFFLFRKLKNKSKFNKLVRVFLVILVICECIWIFKWYDVNPCGWNFVWLK